MHAPGRINVLGEHTDTSEGYCLPACVDREMLCAFAASDDERIRVVSLDVPGLVDLGSDLEVAPSAPSFARYVAAVAGILAERGRRVSGLVLTLDSNIPPGGGMSSSAALCVALTLAMSRRAEVELSALDVALIARAAEHRVGVHCGLMDQYAIVHGKAGQAMLLDSRRRTHEDVPLALEGYVFVVGDTKKERGLVDSEYNARRSQVEEAARVLDAGDGLIESLRDATPELVEARSQALGPLLTRRARHVVEENARTLAAGRLLSEAKGTDGSAVSKRLGQLLDASHASLRDLFEVSCPELDALVGAVREQGGDVVPGARMMGGGFGGCVIALVKEASLDVVVARATETYLARTGRKAAFFPVEVCGGARHNDLHTVPQ